MREADGKTVVLAGAAGAWGDSSLATPQLLEDGRANYVIYEGLAEITMAILSRAQARDRSQGYARDLVETIGRNVDAYRQRGMKVITNAGGVNPHRAADIIRSADGSVRVGVVSGDDLSGSGLVPDGALSAHVYLGAAPIAAALDAGAEVVVTGRIVDSALALGPLIHEFGWSDHDLFSAGSLAGHLIECGPQATGGLMTDWEATRSWANPGYPIAEVSEEGTIVITTPEGSDGVVTAETVTEQLLYEIGDPRRYLLPDVTCDWSEVVVAEVGADRVSVTGARGSAPPATLKACAQIPDGWRATALLFIGGREAAAKAERAGGDLLERGRSLLASAGLGDFRATDIEVIGGESTYGANASAASRDVMLKVAVHHDSREAVDRFIRELPSLGLAGPPGVSGGGMGLPRSTPLIRLECFPVSRGEVAVEVDVDGEPVPFAGITEVAEVTVPAPAEPSPIAPRAAPTMSLPLVAIAHGRSGDKGADVNIGIRARDARYWPVLLRELTVERVSSYLSHLGASNVDRFELPGIHAVNFLLTDGLGAGGTASLRIDPQGKAIAQQLLDMMIDVPAEIVP